MSKAETWDETKRAEASKRARGPRSPKGEGSLYRTTVRNKVVWRAKKTFKAPDGERRTIVGTGQTRAEAQERLEYLHLRWLANNGHIKDADTTHPHNNPLLTSVIEQWMERQEADGVKANTRVRNRSLIKNHITPHFKGRRVKDITEQDIKAFINEHLPKKQNKTGGRLLGPSPVRSIFYILKATFTIAEQDETIIDNPMKHLRAPRKPKADKTSLSYRVDDYSNLFSALSDPTHPKHPQVAKQDYAGCEPFLYWFLAFYGLRQSERLGVGWDSFTNLTPERFTHPDQTDRGNIVVLTIDRQLYNDEEKRELTISDTTKTEAGKRTIPIPPDVAAMFYRWKQKQQEQKQTWGHVPKQFSTLVFTTNQGLPVRQNVDNNRWRQLLISIGMEPLLGHEMRHLTATFLAEMDTPVEQVKLIIGHSKEAMTAYYTHQSENKKHRTILQLHSLLQQRTEEQIDTRVKQKQQQQQTATEYETRTNTNLNTLTALQTVTAHPETVLWETILTNPNIPDTDKKEARQKIQQAKETFQKHKKLYDTLKKLNYDALTADEKLTLTTGPFSPQNAETIKAGGSQLWDGHVFYKNAAFPKTPNTP